MPVNKGLRQWDREFLYMLGDETSVMISDKMNLVAVYRVLDMQEPKTFNELKNFLKSKSGLRTSHIYKPVMLLEVIRNGGSATKQDIARAILNADTKQVDHYQKKIVHQMPGKRLVRDGLLANQGDTYSLAGVLSTLNESQFAEVEKILDQRISDDLEIRYPFGDSNKDAVKGSVRYEVLRRSGSRCELCGNSSKETQIDVDHIIPRAKGGTNEITNLQALCRTCNAQKRDRDDTNFANMHRQYNHREPGCLFCEDQSHVIFENELAFVTADGFPVTDGHSLIIPKRHIADYFSLYRSETNAIDELLRHRREQLQSSDPSISGFNVGINSGESAGQSIFHCHAHLIPRRDGDVDNPRGGIRHVIPGKGDY
jgi:diadenosine tetraphosphate (Ap4A) HIT family hydrolase